MKTGKELTPKEIFTILRRRKFTLVCVTLFCIVFMAIYCAFSPKRYEASGIVQMQKESADAMGLDSMMNSSTSEGAYDALAVNVDLQTQANILQSDTLALKTIAKLHLDATDEFQAQNFLDRFFSPSNNELDGKEPFENVPEKRRRALKIFHRNLLVKPVNGTRLIEIRYQNPDPQLAAKIVNTLIQSLVDYTFQTRFDAVNQTSKWLSDQLGDLRQNSETLQAKVVELERQAGVYGLDIDVSDGSTKAGGGYSEILDRLQQATTALSVAEQNRIMKEAIMRAAKAGDAEMLSGLAGNSIGSNSQSMNNALSLIQTLRQEEATAKATLEQAQAKYGSSYSRVLELRSQLSAIQESIQDEIKRVRARAESDYQVSTQIEQGAQKKYKDIKVQADKLNDKAIEFTIARQDAIQSRSIYEALLRRLKEAGVLEGLRSSNITIVDPGRTPARPKRPDTPLYMEASVVGGLFLGSFSALLIGIFDNKVINITDLEGIKSGSFLGALPSIEGHLKDQNNIVIESPKSPYSESVRAIRTALLLFRSEQPPKTILVTSSIPQEGKSTITLNLASSFAQRDQKVLMVDADLRCATLSRRLDMVSSVDGLSSLLSGMVPQAGIHKIAENLYALPAGPIAPNPSELIDSLKMKTCLSAWAKDYDLVLLDGVPVLPVTDSVPLNEIVETTLLVVRSGMVEKSQVERSHELLSREGKHLVGIVINDLREHTRSYYGNYSYYGQGEDKG